MTQEMTTQKETIPAYNRQELQKAIDKLNRKAAKLGCDPLVLTFDNPHVKELNQHPLNGRKLDPAWKFDMIDATLTFAVPTLNGYELVARLDLFGNVVMVAAVPGQVVPDKYKHLDRIDCDHCGHKRARKHSILVRHIETNEYMQVGTTCVKDFFGFHDPAGFMFKASILLSGIVGCLDEEKGFKNNSDCYGYDFPETFVMSAACIRHWGWMSRGKAMHNDAAGPATADHVIDNLNPWPNMPEELKVGGVTEEDKEEARLAWEYWQTVEHKNNDYLLNCCKLIEIGFVPAKYMGLAVSMVSSYQRHALKLKERELMKAKHGESNHVGAVGERLKGIKVQCIYNRDFENEWGMKTLYSFRDASGNIYKTWYSGDAWGACQGDHLTIDGTVKKHDEFKGEKQTMLTRVKGVLKA